MAIVGGIMLATLTRSLQADPIVQALPDDIQDALDINSVDLAETSIPDTLTAQEQIAVSDAIDSA